MEDMLEDVGEISELLSRSYGMPEGVDEEDLDAELACLEDEPLDALEDFETVQHQAAPAPIAVQQQSFALPMGPTGSVFTGPTVPTTHLQQTAAAVDSKAAVVPNLKA